MTTCACSFSSPAAPHTAEWHRAHKAHHLAKFPLTSEATIASLDFLISLASTGRMQAPRIRGERGVI